MKQIRLIQANDQNIWKLLKLEVASNQKDFIATNTESIIEAYLCLVNHGKVLPFGVYYDQIPVGFVMIGYGVDEGWKNPPKIAKDNYSIWRFMIDRNYQHQGFGKAAMEQVLDMISKKPLGDAEYCYLSYDAENMAAKQFYRSFGFEETGEYDDGERVAAIRL